MNLYFSFTQTGNFSGIYSSPVNGTNFINSVSGYIGQPADVFKMNGTNSVSLYFSQYNLTVANLTTDWTNQLQNKWFISYLNYCGLNSLVNSNYYSTLFNVALSNNIFYELSNPSIAYVNQNTSTGEISIGLNVYSEPFILNYAKSLPLGDILGGMIINLHKTTPILISNVAKITYQNYTDYVWCFDGITYNYDISNIPTPSLTNGGGNIFGEVKLAGNGIMASYIVKKNIDPLDPTIGLASGTNGPFCTGDEIILIDTTTWTKNYGTNGATTILSNELFTNFYNDNSANSQKTSSNIYDISNVLYGANNLVIGDTYQVSFFAQTLNVYINFYTDITLSSINTTLNTSGYNTFTFIATNTNFAIIGGLGTKIMNFSLKQISIAPSWTWLGDYTQLSYTWDIADISDISKYKNVYISDMLFPLRVIQQNQFGDFN